MTEKREKNFGSGFEGILKGFTGLMEKLSELADKGGEFSRTGEIPGLGKAKDIKGVYGFSIKTGLGGEGLKVEPFGNIRKDAASGESVVQEIREPIVDVLEEEGYTLVVAEMPGISAEDVRLEVKDDLLTIVAEKRDKRFRKELLLPKSYPKGKMQISCNNGVVEIKCRM